MPYETCKICGEFDFLSTHRCKPTWYVRHDDEGYEDIIVYAHDEREAAERYVEKYDNCRGEGITKEIDVLVKSTAEGCGPFKFTVYCELVPSYTARPCENE